MITERYGPGKIDGDSGEREHWAKNFLPRSAIIIMLAQKNRLVDTQRQEAKTVCVR